MGIFPEIWAGLLSGSACQALFDVAEAVFNGNWQLI
jgi:hypothetical protein